MYRFKQGMRKSLSVAAVFFILAWTQANAWADEILVSAAASLTDVLKGNQHRLPSEIQAHG